MVKAKAHILKNPNPRPWAIQAVTMALSVRRSGPVRFFWPLNRQLATETGCNRYFEETIKNDQKQSKWSKIVFLHIKLIDFGGKLLV